MALAESSVLVRAPCWLARFQKNNGNYMQNPTRIICWSTKLDDQTEGSSASISLTSSKSWLHPHRARRQLRQAILTATAGARTTCTRNKAVRTAHLFLQLSRE